VRIEKKKSSWMGEWPCA